MREISRATSAEALRVLHQRARALVLDQWITPSSLDWLARFAHLVDVRILQRVAQWIGPPDAEFCWCFYGASGREESWTPVAPGSAVILGDPGAHAHFVAERAGHAMHTALVLKMVRDRSLWEMTTSEEASPESEVAHPEYAVGQAASD